MDLGKPTAVVGTVIGQRNSCRNCQYVTRYKVQTSLDGKTFTEVPGQFKGSGPQDWSEYQALFPSAIMARYVRLVVLAWKGHISMRADVLTCDNGVYGSH